MKRILLSIILLVALSMVISSEIDHTDQVRKILDSFMDSKPKELFKIWHLLYKRQYTFDSEEAKLRFKNFKINLAIVKETNQQNLGYKFGLNQFSDLSKEEFTETYTTRRPNLNLEQDIAEFNKNLGFLANQEDDDDLTKRNLQMVNIDYTKLFLGARNQGTCNSCWTFATTGVIEGNMAKKLGSPISYLSPQQLVDCDPSNSGCNGGNPYKALTYLQTAGVMQDKDYPYTSKKGTCAFDDKKTAKIVKGIEYCSNYTTKKCTTELFYSLLARGPLSIGIDGNAVQGYTNGLFLGACNSDNHAVVAIGYGTEGGKSYWIVRNSWGPSWGEKGNLRVLSNLSNKYSCFVENEGMLPIV